VTLEQALMLLSLPRSLGQDVDGGTILARPGRFGPYLEKTIPGEEKPQTRSLKHEEELLTVTLAQAQALFAIPKRGRGAPGGASQAALKELGVDPTSGSKLVIKDGRYGPYVTDGTTNASLPKGTAVEGFDLQAGLRLLEERRASAPAKKKKTARRSATRS
jgi:DNA topoisomerase I